MVPLSSDFWDAYKGIVLVGNDGAIRFTRAGRARYAPLLAKYGFAIDQVKRVERFRDVIGAVIDGEIEVNTHLLEKALHNPLTSAFEREFIRRVLAHGIQSTE
jgi:hypothetical protein